LICINAQQLAGEQTRIIGDDCWGRSYTMSINAIQHEGKSFPLGATPIRDGANFSVFAKHSCGWVDAQSVQGSPA
jgi:hypothetical protein